MLTHFLKDLYVHYLKVAPGSRCFMCSVFRIGVKCWSSTVVRQFVSQSFVKTGE